MTRDSHDPRCERSTTKRCRCDCQGNLHGREASQIDLEAAQRTLAEATDDELLNAIGDVLGKFESTVVERPGDPAMVGRQAAR
jgi:hypothetical protein